MGAILLHPKDRQAIHKYLTDMGVEINGFLHRQMDEIDSEELMKVMNRISKELPSNKFPFDVEYIFSIKHAKGYFDKTNNKVVITVSYFADWHAGVRQIEHSYTYEHLFFVTSVDFKSMESTFVHEFVHFIQHQFRLAKSGDYTIPSNWSDSNKYYKQGWERQAHAIGYLEKLKREMNIRKPEEILSQLKKMGVLHNADLNKLKQSDYESWKAIMKQAIMATIADIEDRKAVSA